MPGTTARLSRDLRKFRDRLRPTEYSDAHTIDEWVGVDDLVACAQALAVTAMRFSA